MTDKKVDQFVHLHSHFDTSILDGYSTTPEVIAEVARLGQPAIAMTDHGNLHGIYDLYKHAQAAGIKPIAGLEAYMAPSIVNRHHRGAAYLADGGRDDVSGRGAYTHLTLLAENNEGLKNLYQMNMLSYTEGFYQKNRIDLELLEQYGKGIIATTGCPSGEVQTRLRLGQDKEALEFAAKLQDILGKENVYMELMEHGMSSELERGVRSRLLDIATKLNMPLVATNDLHYAKHGDAKAHEELLCVQTRSTMSQQPDHKGGTRFAFEGDEYYVKSRAEMEKYFDHLPEALNNTLVIAERCNITIEPDDTLRPTITPPDGITEFDFLRQEAIAGLEKRLPNKKNDPEYIERLNTELDVIKQKNYVGYFLVVSDFVRWGKFVADPPVPTGFGRGSAAGSLLGYCLDITDVDPIKYDLLFERFINPERDSPPDIDMDFNDTDRSRVIEYVIEKYGRDKVAQIATFGKIGAKAAIKDTVRILEQPFSMGEELSKALPEPVAGHSITLHDVYDPSSERYHEAGEFRELVKKLNAQEIVDIARSFEGRTRSTGVHAAALVVSTKPVVETVPMMQRQADGAMITQWDYPTCEGLGLLKVDFLGLRNLGIIANAVKNIEKTKGIKLDIQEIIAGEMDDPKTYEMLASGESLGVFQLDSCLAGDTLVSGRKISKLYEDYKNDKGIKTTYSVSLDSGKRVRNDVLRIVQSGVKPVYRLVSESGKMIEATLEHRFMTDSGWKKLGEIDINVDKVLVDQTVKTLHYKECLDCGTKLKSEQANKPSERCYKCSATYYSNPSKIISREAIAKSRKAFYESGGEPWNKGLTKDDHASLATVSRKVQEKLKGRNIHRERLTEEEYEQYITDISAKMSGKGNPMYGKTTRISKSGYREDIGHYVRSTWEADYARVLNFIDEPYLYEPKTFELTRENGSTITYTPDFYLINKDVYVEIKGFMRDLDAEKIKLIQEQYDIKLEVIQSSEFAELQLKYKDLVAWECPRIPETTEWETITSITYVNEQMTYDISMKAPLNNFLANGFMVHNSGLRSLMKLMRPTNFNDISALIALYRPGPMGVDAHTDYALRKNGEQAVTPIHPELEEPLADILNETYSLITYQEQIMRIAQKVADYSLAQADNLRRAMGKKKKSVLDAEYVPFSEGMKKNGYSDAAIKALWEILIPFADYGFNKCVSDRTKIRLADNTPMSAREIYNAHLRGEEIWLQAMWPDGEIKPHKVEKVVSTGVKEIWRVKTADNRTIEVTPDHRLLTTRGYIKAEDMVVGEDELIVGDKLYSEKQIENAVHNIRKAHNKPLTDAQINARHNNMMVWNSSDSPEKLAHNERNAERMRKYQAGLTFEDRSEHQKHINETNDRGDKTAAMMRERKSWLYENDEDFRNKTIEHLAKVRRDGYDSGSGFGKTCYASNGMMCDSLNELRMAEFLIENGIEFEMHKLIGKGECDFYFEGLYWEMDGMDRHISYFERKYGDIPFVVVTPEDYMERISDILKLEHARNGDLIVSIEKLERKRATIDIEMSEGGPKNYVTWKGIVSHNSHSVGYGVLSYLTAFLKANYPSEFMSALLTSVADDTDKTALYLEDCRVLGIKVTPPSINTSQVDYAPINDRLISFGFRAIRGVGEKAAEEIVEVRGDEPFVDVQDFVNRVPKTLANKRILEALTLGGAFDDLGVSRKSMMEAIPDIAAAVSKANRKPTKAQQAKLDQLALFEDYVPEKPKVEFVIPDNGEYSKLEKLKLERHALGLYVSGHPLEGLDMDAAGASKVVDFVEERIKPIEGWVPRDAKPFKIGGIVTSLSKKRTKKGDTFAIGTVEDLTGSIPFVMFPKAFADHGEFLKLDGVYQFSGFPRKRDIDGVSFTVDAIRPLEFSESGKLSLRVKLTEKQWVNGKDAFFGRLARHEASGVGSTNVIVSIKNESGDVWEETLDMTVRTSPALTQEIRELFGMLSIGRWRKPS